MALDNKVSALTAALRSEFWKSWDEVAVPADWNGFTTVIPSTTKIENYVNFTPVPGMTQWTGFRNYGRVDSFIYSIQNLTYHNGILATLEDIEDDQTGGLMSKPKELVVRAREFPGRAVLKALSLGTSKTGFDGTNFAATSHNFGTGSNSFGYNTGASDSASLTTNLWGLFSGNPVLKPLVWQNRSGPLFETNAGTPQSMESRQVRWWCDLRGAAAYGWWFNAVYCQILGTPSITDMHAIYNTMTTRFRSFQLPKTISTEDGEYIHEQTRFSTANFWLAGSTILENLLRQSLQQDWVPQTAVIAGSTTSSNVATTNLWQGFANYTVSAFLN